MTKTPSSLVQQQPAQQRGGLSVDEIEGHLEHFVQGVERAWSLSVALESMRHAYPRQTLNEADAIRLVRALRRCWRKASELYVDPMQRGFILYGLDAMVDLASHWTLTPQERKVLLGREEEHMRKYARIVQNIMHTMSLLEEIAMERREGEGHPAEAVTLSHPLMH